MTKRTATEKKSRTLLMPTEGKILLSLLLPVIIVTKRGRKGRQKGYLMHSFLTREREKEKVS